jgi:hypothetical protein
MATAKKPAKKAPIKKVAKRTAAKRTAAKRTASKRSAMAPDLARKVAAAAEAAGSERLTAVEHAADRLGRYLREHRNTLKGVTPLLLAGSEKAPQLILESDLSFRVRSIDERKRSSMDRASTAEVVELWAAADLYDRLEAALRRAAGLSSRPTGAIIAGLGVAGDHGAKV